MALPLLYDMKSSLMRNPIHMMLERWEEMHRECAAALETMVWYVGSLQSEKREATQTVRRIVDAIDTEELRRYVERGCRCKMDQLGWQAAKRAQDALDLVRMHMRGFAELLVEMKRALSKAMQETMDSGRQCSSPADECFPAGDMLFLVAVKIDQLEKEHILLVAMESNIHVFSPISQLRSYLTVWKLRPFVDDTISEELHREMCI